MFGAIEFSTETRRGKSSFSRICEISDDVVPKYLVDFFRQNSQGLNSRQKESFAEFLKEFQGAFFEQIVAGNCYILQHEIKLQNSRPINQASRRVPLQIRAEVTHRHNNSRNECSRDDREVF